MLIFGAAPRGQNKRLKDVLTSLGLTTNLQLCLDAGDINSYTGSGKWLDTSGGGYDFDNNGATFNGTAGRQSGAEYFSFDGGDYLSYDTTIESWMQALHKAGAMSAVAVMYIAADSGQPTAFSTSGTSFSYHGCVLYYSATNNRIQFTTHSSAPSSVTIGAEGPDISSSLPGLFFIGLTTTIGSGNAYTININGTNYSGNWGSFTPSTTNPTYNMKLGALGDAVVKSPNGTRLLAQAIWQGTALSADNLTSIFNSVRGKYGL